MIIGIVLAASFPLMVTAAENLPDAFAKIILEKAGIRVGICELPQAGDGMLATALTQAGVAQVHALASAPAAADKARKPAAIAGVLGSHVIIETGTPEALPLSDWVADLYVVADATDVNLKTISATETVRV
ncbi:MAG: hypothetical protein WCI73_12100, partial [Phycisphaerae bacterium]